MQSVNKSVYSICKRTFTFHNTRDKLPEILGSYCLKENDINSDSGRYGYSDDSWATSLLWRHGTKWPSRLCESTPHHPTKSQTTLLLLRPYS